MVINMLKNIVSGLELIEFNQYHREDYVESRLCRRLGVEVGKEVVGNLVGVPEYFVKGVLNYYRACWSMHRVAVVTPDIVWQVLLGEIAGLVRDNPEKYRNYFSSSSDVTDIVVHGGRELEISLFLQQLSKLVPIGVVDFLPKFSTSSILSQFANKATFMDVVSPYYSYSMMMCGIPAIDIRGTDVDWELLLSSWVNLGKLFLIETDPEYYHKVLLRIFDIDDNDWGDFIKFPRCGSGSDVEVSGWILDLYVDRKVSLKYPDNFSDSIGIVKYRNITLGEDFRLYAGILGFNDDPITRVFEPVWSLMRVDKVS
jgi:hypothetical protein